MKFHRAGVIAGFGSPRPGSRLVSRPPDRGCSSLWRAFTVSAALLIVSCTGASEAGPPGGSDGNALEYLSGIDLSGTDGIGGLSGLFVSGDGNRLTAIADDGRVLTGPLVHLSSGTLQSWTVERTAPLPGLAGLGKTDADAEALLRQPDGSWLVAFERRHRILRYPRGDDAPEGEPTPIPIPPSMKSLPANKGIEALALRSDGILVAFAEAGETADGQHRLYMRQDGRWTEKRYRTDPFFAPSDAAALPNGDLLVLDRGYSLVGGVRTRLVHVESEVLLGTDVIEGTILADLEPPIGSDNFEGLAVRRSPEGGVFVYLVSDDNFSPLQRTLLIQYALHLPNLARAWRSP